MKIAAIQMQADLANVSANLAKAEKLARQAFKAGAQWVILPEFFTSAVGYSRKMENAALPIEGPAMTMLKTLAREFSGMIGGSYIAWKSGDCFNTFILAAPDGRIWCHDKDLPTMWENCYYVGGSDDGVFDAQSCRVGVALCWEFIRSMTARRMNHRVDMVVGGSCWWTLPEKRLPGFPRRLHDDNLNIMKTTIPRFARMLGVPVVHAAHAGRLEGGLPLLPGFPYRSCYLGETQIVDGLGNQLGHMDQGQGDGFITADLDLERKPEPSEPIPDTFWIPDLPWQLRFVWAYQEWHGRRYYRRRYRQRIERRFRQ